MLFPSSRFMCKYFPLITIFLQQRSIGFQNRLIFLKLTKFDCSVREEKSKYSIKHFFNLNGSLRVLHCISSLKSLRKLERIVTLLNCPLSIPYRGFILQNKHTEIHDGMRPEGSRSYKWDLFFSHKCMECFCLLCGWEAKQIN